MNFQNQKIVETKNCQLCKISFDITDKDLEFYDKVSPIFDGEKYSIPTPKLCPECRQQRRLSFRNERNLYKRKCDATGKDIISIYSGDKNHKIYEQKFWWSDKWEALDYGFDFDFKKGFFEQFNELINIVPRNSIINSESENATYTNFSSSNSDCYYTFGMFFNKNVHYSHYGSHCNDTLDSLRVSHCELCYECINCEKSYKLFFSQDSQNCQNSWFLRDCINCQDCFDCVNLKNKQYFFKNKKYTKEAYMEKINGLKKNNHSDLGDMKQKVIISQALQPHKFMVGVQNENVIGDFLYNCNNCVESFNIGESEDCKYAYQVDRVQVGQDMNCMGYDKSEYCYECTGDTGVFNTLFTECVWNSSNILYCGQCFNSSYLFGCVGLKNMKYCIFNKQYSKEEYNILVPKIINQMKQIGEWGEFFPSSISPFGYNETVAQENFLLEKENAVAKSFNWSDYQVPLPKVDKIIPANQLPENIIDIPNDILNWAIECEITKKPFRIIPQELDFYRNHSLPIPRRHPDKRHLERVRLKNPTKLFKRDCDKCNRVLHTTYAPGSKKIVYCEGCYEKEMY